MATEHVPSHQGRADIGKRRFNDHGALVALSAFKSKRRTPEREREGPLVQARAADSERVVHALVRAGHEPIERHGNRKSQL